MILRSITLSNWRCYLNPVPIGPFHEGLNIIHGPNATGKSTLFEALQCAILNSHRVTGKDIDACRPWGRSLPPTVTIEFTNDGIDYRVTKQFLIEPSSTLERKENGRYTRLHIGADADIAVREILTRSAPGRGLARYDNWGIAQVLWAPQGRLELKGLSGDVLENIRASLGTQVSETAGNAIERRIDEKYYEIFTAKGNLKTGRDAPELISLKEEAHEVEEIRNDALAVFERFNDVSRRVEDLRARRSQARYDAEGYTETLKHCREQAEIYKGLTTEKRRREEEVKAEEALYNELKLRIDQINAARRELLKGKESIQKFEAVLPLEKKEAALRLKEEAKAKSSKENIRKEREKIKEARRLADEARQFIENKNTLTSLKDRRKAIADAQDELASRKKERAQFLSPDANTLKEIRREVAAREEARLTIDASLITLEVVPENNISIEVIEAEHVGAIEAKEGSPIQIKGSPEVVAELRGIARLRASGPTGSTEEFRKLYDESDSRIIQLTKPFGTDDLQALEHLAEKGDDLDQKVAEAKTHLDTLLGKETLEDIDKEIVRLETLQATLVSEHSAWEKSPPNPANLAQKAEERSLKFTTDIDAAESAHEKALAALSAIREQIARTETSLKAERERLESIQDRINKLTEDGKEDDELKEEMSRKALSWHAAQESLKEILEQLKGFTDDPNSAVAKLESQLKAAGQTAERAFEEEKIEEGVLQTISLEGPYSVLADAEERLVNLEQRIKIEENRVDAIELLHEIVMQCRNEALSAIAGPVEEAATRMIKRIAGEGLGLLNLGESLKPDLVNPVMAGTTVAVEELSGGEQEQIHLATRLALAEVLAKGERQLMVFDDVLAVTDSGRLARVLTILEEESRHVQIIFLTCHPERYRGLEDASFFDLGKIRRQASM